ncbi:hypothetical protein SDRG_12460 [Saprolegnia diclina VS20]|uniref:Uncharacterized protein n=1 Tax=Saprolegnia diclina (strain VS20) TaxID=1156394 RepID=T0Q5Q2_SAPDV|nr:hypothetical protein SDRG_12460 [Saprolegnia diclina VS20]EQC29916.1 hypothetical protein SDRG_12460 [Saprolegnia diclina VS20]|eukprot:XP_008616755.1 hypothetical protein SDRG_12460 [Saprolegnia diclina VS20]
MDRSGSEAYELVGSAKSRLDEIERDRMDLKMEVAHLRSRLLERVGGDTSALELEEESFMLKKELITKERMLAEQAGYLSGLEQEHQKALMNLQKLDAAWRASAVKTQQLQETLEMHQKKAHSLDAMRKVLQAQDEAARALQEKIDELQASLAAKDRAAASAEVELHAATEDLAAARMELHAQATANDAVHRSTALDLEHAKEKIAHGQGQVSALREHAEHLEQANTALETSNGLLKAKVLQLTEENAASSIHASTSKSDYQRKVHECTALQDDVEKLTADVYTRDVELQLSRQTVAALEQELDETRRERSRLDERVTTLDTLLASTKTQLHAAESTVQRLEGAFNAQVQSATELEGRLAETTTKLRVAEQTIAHLDMSVRDAKKAAVDTRALEVQITKRIESELETTWRTQVLAAEHRARELDAAYEKNRHELMTWQSDVCTRLGVASPADVALMLERRDHEHAELLRSVETLQNELRRAKTQPRLTEAKPVTPSSPSLSTWTHEVERTERFRLGLRRDTTAPVATCPTPETKPPPKIKPPKTELTPKITPTPETKPETSRTTTLVSTHKPLSRPVDAKPTTPRALDLFKPSPLSFRPVTLRKPLDLKASGPRSTPSLVKPVFPSTTPVAATTRTTPTTTPTTVSEPRRLFPSRGTPEVHARSTASGSTLLGLKRKAGDLSLPTLPKPKFSFGKSRFPKAP